MSNRYVDIPAVIQVIGNVYKNPNLMDSEKYRFNLEDFTEEFHRTVFGTIYNLHAMGAKDINVNVIEDYLKERPQSLAVYQVNKGREYLEQVSQAVQLSTFEYYYNRMKKMTLLRMYDNAGMDLSWLYDVDNILDTKKKEAQEDWFDNHSLEEIAEIVNKRIEDIRLKYVDGSDNQYVQAGDGILELVKRLQEVPEDGYPLFGPYVNTITRGARLKKLYLRSAATGVGKTRAMIADACSIACDEIYDEKLNKWVPNADRQPTLYITTEQEVDEVQTMMLAFLSAVDEGHILYNKYEPGEWERVVYAANLIKKASLHIKKLPDFNLQDIENTIKYAHAEWGCQYIFLDYLHTSMKILTEITSKAGVKGLREDNILFLIAVRLKDLCNEYGVFIMTSTQLNAEYREAQVYDQNLLRGAKSIADKIDYGAIMLQTSQEDKDALKGLVSRLQVSDPSIVMPNIKMSVYKNRRGQYKDILLWCNGKRGICRIEPMFATDYNYQFVELPDLKINIKPHMSSAAF